MVNEVMHVAMNMNRDETLERVEREKVEEMVRYVITYDPRLPPVSQLLFNNWKTIIS